MKEYDLTTQKGKATFVEDQNSVGDELINLHVWMHEHPTYVTRWHIKRYTLLKKQAEALKNIHARLFNTQKRK